MGSSGSSGDTTTRVVTGVRVEYRRFRFPPGSRVTGGPVCVDDPDDCCAGGGGGSGSGGGGSGVVDDPVTVECCPNPLPRTLYARLGGGGEHTIAARLEYQDGSGRWEYAGPMAVGGGGGLSPLANGYDGLSLRCDGPGYWYLRLYYRSDPGAGYTDYDGVYPTECDPLSLSFPPPLGAFQQVEIVEPGQAGWAPTDPDHGEAPDGSSFVPTACCPTGTSTVLRAEADTAPAVDVPVAAPFGVPGIAYAWTVDAGVGWDPYTNVTVYCDGGGGGGSWKLLLRDPIAPDELTFTATSATCYEPGGVSVFSLTFEGTPHGNVLVTIP